jgi:site-specific DNA-methyltransferase (adenine-specific)
MSFDLHTGNCLDVLATMPDNSVHAIVTDPPYGLAFMGKKWDYDVPSEEIWRECLRVLKPGGHLLAFAGTRTQHRMAVRIEDAGFEIRDMIAWVYGSGFPKSHNVAIGIDKMNGAPPRGKALVVAGRGEREDLQGKDANPRPQELEAYAPATPAAKQWQGWGTALKPALEPITVARKPFTGTVAANVLEWGTGGVNVDGSRVPCESGQGRFPANLIHDGSEEVVGLFPETTQASWRKPQPDRAYPNAIFPQAHEARERDERGYADSGSAARFFYCAKASKRDRDEGCEGMPLVETMRYSEKAQGPLAQQTPSKPVPQRNHHPTVKPTDLMRYLCRLVTPPDGIVLDPFMGSGSTGKAAILEGFQFIGIDMTPEYVDIARARIKHAVNSKPNKLNLE